MSRGWESKDVESQMEEAASRRSAARKAPLTEDQIRVEGERHSLELSRARVVKDLEATTHERRRAQLQAAREYLEKKIAELG